LLSTAAGGRQRLALPGGGEGDQVVLEGPKRRPLVEVVAGELLRADGRLGQVTLGLDAARQGYWTEFGGSPGMTFLLGPFAEQMAERGLDEAARQEIFVAAPAAAFTFAAIG